MKNVSSWSLKSNVVRRLNSYRLISDVRSFLQAVNTGEEITVKTEPGVDEQIEAARRDAFCEVRQSTFVFREPLLRINLNFS